MNYNTLITRMYFLVAFADGRFDQKEVMMGRQLAKTESLDETEFNVQLQLLKGRDRAQLLVESIEALKKLEYKQHVRGCKLRWFYGSQ
jgi:hypothetical protein